MTHIDYRALSAHDSPVVSHLIQSVAHEFIEPDLTPEGFQNVLDVTSVEPIRELLSSEKTVGFVAFITLDSITEIVGVSVIRDWFHVHFLFVAGHYHRQGIARKVFDRACAECRKKDPDLNLLTVNSTLFAVEAYQKLGFVPIAGGRHQHNGGIFVSMEKHLNS